MIFHVPLLHKNLASKALPADIHFLNAGLPDTHHAKGTSSFSSHTTQAAEAVQPASSAELAFVAALPLPPAAARATLSEMLSLAEYMPQEALRRLAYPDMTSPQGRRTISAEERNSLESFSFDGSLPEVVKPSLWAQAPKASAESLQNALIDCQKVLLLASHLEAHQQEIQTLTHSCHKAEENLAAILQEDTEFLDIPSTEKKIQALALSQDAPCPWRMIIDAALPFLPQGAILFTDNPTMTLALREAGMLQPLPEGTGELCLHWPQELVTGLLWNRLPAWRLVGRRGPSPDRPWLEQEIEIIVARPSGGWLVPKTEGCTAP